MDRLARRLESGACEPFIRHIRFPNLKNLEPGLTLEFRHPITALVGPNGTNKTTILRALEGCPLGMDLGRHWFETGLDRVETDAARYIHAYRLPSGGTAEVIKTRVGRRDRRRDYFETRAPRKTDGMAPLPTTIPRSDRPYASKTRWNPVDKEVLYLDFRHAIPAFDIHFLFNHSARDNAVEKKKSLVRRRAGRLAEVLNSKAEHHAFYGRERILEPVSELSGEELSTVSTILGREYESIRLVAHDLFDVEGRTALIGAKGLRYSEAFAGSGEFAVISLVHQLSRAAKASLVLLDEPETSLHPRAQEELLRHIARVALQKGLQVVMATHSPAFIEMLPPDSVKVLDLAESGKVRVVSDSASPREAFTRIGASVERATAYVEDALAQAILLRAARVKGADAVSAIDIRPLPGGAASIRTAMVPALAVSSAKHVIVLDGDQRPASPLTRTEALSAEGVRNELQIIGVARRMRDSDEDDDSPKAVRRDKELHDWCRRRLLYLPGTCPENLLLEMLGQQVREDAIAAKAYWVEMARSEFGLVSGESPTADDILGVQRRALAEVEDGSPLLVQVVAVVEELLRL